VPEETTKKLLIVDDEPPMCKLLVKIFSKTGEYRVHSAADGIEALEVCEKEGPFDLILCDIQMPRLCGDELVGRIMDRWPNSAIIMLTSLRTDEAVVKCLDRGALDYLTKPIEVAKLLRTVERALSRREQLPEDLGPLQVKSEVRGWVELTAPSHFEYVERFQRFVQQLYETELSREEVEDVRVAIDEIGQNAVEWGNREDASKNVHLSYCLFHDRVVFKIEDEGEGFDIAKLRDPSKDPLAHIMERISDGKRMGGYGIFMSRSIMDDIQYSERGNIVVMTKLFSSSKSESQSGDEGEEEPERPDGGAS
jgi:CheY-like chemotaxis protein/anti-sigma regulatory factor (Ser/Thr protein kinase)